MLNVCTENVHLFGDDFGWSPSSVHCETLPLATGSDGVTSISLKHESPIDTIDLDFALSAIDLYRSSICLQDKIQGVRFMVFNVTFNNISVISWMSVLLVEETGIHGENTDLPQVTDKLNHIMLY